MKGRLAALDTLPDGRRAAALMVDGQLEDLLIDAPETFGPIQPGAIFLGKVGRPMKGQGGCFVELGDGTGFLREAKGLAPGTRLLVQVSGVAEPGKAPPVTSRILFKSRYAIVTPDRPGVNVSRRIRDEDTRALLQAAAAEVELPEGAGLILRSAAAHADPDTIIEDIAAMAGLACDILADDSPAPALLVEAPDAHLAAWRDWADPEPDEVLDGPGSFDDAGVWEAIAAARAPEERLPGGGFMAVEPTRALVAVDVNTGPDSSPAAGLKANVAALRALPRALRLRGLAGQIILDLAPFPKRERSQLEQVLTAAVRQDASEISVAGWTPLGHLELQRKRDRHPLEMLIRDALPDL